MNALKRLLRHSFFKNERRRKQSRAGGGGTIWEKGTLFYFGKQAEKPNFKK